MIVLDANVVSEPMKAQGDPAVTAWLDRQVANTLYLTATSLSELLAGIELLPEGRRRSGLGKALTDLVKRLFGRARAAGHMFTFADGQVAAIAAAHGFTVATRDTVPFAAAGVPVIDPWGSQRPGPG